MHTHTHLHTFTHTHPHTHPHTHNTYIHTSGEAAEKLGHVLQLAKLRKFTLAVAAEYNDTHMDALMQLHALRAKDTVPSAVCLVCMPYMSSLYVWPEIFRD